MPVGSENSSTCLTEKREPNVGNRIGQKTAEGHLGTNKTLPALETSRCKMVREIKYTGGTSQLSSPAQLVLNGDSKSNPTIP